MPRRYASQTSLSCRGALTGAALVCVACGKGEVPLDAGARVGISRLTVLTGDAAANDLAPGAIENGGAVAVDSAHVALLDWDRARIVVVDTVGRVSNAFGRRGPGPGEIGNARFLIRSTTGLAVFDDRHLAFIRFGVRDEIQEPLPIDSLMTTLDALEQVAQLDDGSWVYSVTEIRYRDTPPTLSRALYVRAGGASRLIARTPVAGTTNVRTPCGIGLTGRPPVFWPTLRWSASGTQVAYAATADDRVVIWNATQGDSTVLSAGLTSPAASEAAAIAATGGLQVSMGGRGCDLASKDLVRQRGMAKVIPAIDRVSLSPDGTLWVRPTSSDKRQPPIRVFASGRVDTLTSTAFPAFFLTPRRFVAEEKDGSGTAIASIWEIRRPR